jgi:hypothetical protein
MPKGEQNAGQELETFFISDLNGLYRQHEAMWSIYNESLKILVTLTSLPFLVAALLVRQGKDVPTWTQILPPLRPVLLLTPILDVFMVSVVVNHRLSVLLYARAINGYRGLFLEKFPAEKVRFEAHIRLPVKSDRPPFYEPWGPMGVIVHGMGLVGGVYWALGIWPVSGSWLGAGAAAAYLGLLEYLYYANCRKYRPAAET